MVKKREIKTDKKIVFVFSYFSYLRAFSNIKKIFSNECEISFLHYKINPSEKYYDSNKLDTQLEIQNINNFSELKGYDSIFLGLGGKDLENALHEINTQKNKVITLFPGIRNPYDFQGLIARCSSDIMLFNNSSDMEDYAKLGKNIKIDTSNALLFGFPNLVDPIKATNGIKNQLCFIAQSEIISKAHKLYLLKKFIGFCNKNPDKELVILEKSKGKISVAHTDKYDFDKLLEKHGNKPKNLKVSYNKLEDVLSSSELVFSISSSGVLESIYNKIKTALISDFGISETLGNVCYLNSDLFMTVDDILSANNIKINKSWVNDYIVNPRDNLEQLKVKLEESKLKLFNQSFFEQKIEQNNELKISKKEYINKLSFSEKTFRRIKKIFKNPSSYLKDSKYSFLNKLGKTIYGR